VTAAPTFVFQNEGGHMARTSGVTSHVRGRKGRRQAESSLGVFKYLNYQSVDRNRGCEVAMLVLA